MITGVTGVLLIKCYLLYNNIHIQIIGVLMCLFKMKIERIEAIHTINLEILPGTDI